MVPSEDSEHRCVFLLCDARGCVPQWRYNRLLLCAPVDNHGCSGGLPRDLLRWTTMVVPNGGGTCSCIDEEYPLFFKEGASVGMRKLTPHEHFV